MSHEPLIPGTEVTFIVRDGWTDPYALIERPHVVIERVGVGQLGDYLYWLRHPEPEDLAYSPRCTGQHGPYTDGDLLEGWI